MKPDEIDFSYDPDYNDSEEELQEEIVEADIVIETMKIVDPIFLTGMKNRIKEYRDTINDPDITPASLYSYFSKVVTTNRQGSEFWVVFENGTLAGFCYFYKKGLPFINSVHMNQIYTWGTIAATEALITEFYKFGKKYKGSSYRATVRNEQLFRRFKQLSIKFNAHVEKLNSIIFVAKINEDTQ